MREAAIMLHAPSAGTYRMGQEIRAREVITDVWKMCGIGDGLTTWRSDMHTGGFASR
jgi:hypothetical protein